MSGEAKPTILLAPCPFCGLDGGEEPVVCIRPKPKGYWEGRVECPGCGGSITRGYTRDIGEVATKAVVAWNTREGVSP